MMLYFLRLALVVSEYIFQTLRELLNKTKIKHNIMKRRKSEVIKHSINIIANEIVEDKSRKI